MANLAIKGHANRGKEVIEILEMFGGVNKYEISDANLDLLYTIRSHDKFIISVYPTNTFIVFTLEEFLEKFPYKVGDKVIAYAEGCLAQFTIQNIRWNYELNKVEYKICSSWCDTSLMIPYKKETMDRANKAVFDANAQCCDIMNHIIKEKAMEEIKIDIPAQYPKTYEECCEILNICPNGDIVYAGNWVYGGEYLEKHLERIRNFQKLRICRDAYWKIAGEEMGLGKPWEPNWRNSDEDKHCIEYSYGRIDPIVTTNIYNYILAFPTKEMRDAFYENFKDLIEYCKDFL